MCNYSEVTRVVAKGWLKSGTFVTSVLRESVLSKQLFLITLSLMTLNCYNLLMLFHLPYRGCLRKRFVSPLWLTQGSRCSRSALWSLCNHSPMQTCQCSPTPVPAPWQLLLWCLSGESSVRVLTSGRGSEIWQKRHPDADRAHVHLCLLPSGMASFLLSWHPACAVGTLKCISLAANFRSQPQQLELETDQMQEINAVSQ